jgi:[ribosomal protein S5]-alanine N-acetyltransferase
MKTAACDLPGQFFPRFDDIAGRLAVLRPFTLDDVNSIYVSWLNDKSIVRYSNQRFLTHSIESCKNYVTSFSGSPNRLLKIVSRDNGQMVGTMTAYAVPHHGTVDMGILLGGATIWRRGFGQDAWNTLLDWLMSIRDVRKVTGGCVRSNTAMVRIMERSGMELEAVRIKQEIVDGEFQDVLHYAKFRQTT